MSLKNRVASLPSGTFVPDCTFRSFTLQRDVYNLTMAVRMCMLLVDGGGAKAVQKFVSLNIAAISVLAVTILPAWPTPLNAPAQLVKRPRRFRNPLCFYATHTVQHVVSFLSTIILTLKFNHAS